MQSADAWLRTFGRLNVYRAKGGQAPHKPLLLLVILEAAERGELPAGELELARAGVSVLRVLESRGASASQGERGA